MTIPPKTTIEPDLRALRNLPAALDLAAFEQVEGSLFRPVGELPPWLHAPPGENIDLADRFPMLELFLPGCEDHWQGESDLWTEPDGRGGEFYLQASAALVHQRRFLVLRTLPDALHTYQQLAHDFELEKDKVQRLSAELEIKRDEAERATRAKSDFLAKMSHEIRTPLNAVIGMADVLSSTSLTAEQRRCVEVSQRNGIGLLNLINDILDLAKVESGKVELENTVLDVRDVISRAMEVVEARAAAKDLWLRTSIAPGTPLALVGDPNRLRQVLINLLGNSIKFTETGGLEVRVEAEVDPALPSDHCRLRFAVVDTGIGIAADKINAVFESFTQADTSTTRKYGGTGLGLTISKQLVELMGGRIWLESTLGVGSTFLFTAEFAIQSGVTPDSTGVVPAPKPEVAQQTLAEMEHNLAGLRILLADDSEDNRFLILSYLRRTSSSIDIAENGQLALDLFHRNPYDVILMDVEMPVMDGYTATRAIRDAEQASGVAPTPVLALTAHAFLDMAEKGIAAGFTEMLTKPIRNVTLLQALAKFNRSQRLAPAAIPAPDAIRVAVEEGMEDVVPRYLAKRKAEIPLYFAALEKGDMEAIGGMGHRMKGTGTGYGFPVLTELGGALEKAAQLADAGEIRRKTLECESYLNAVELEYK